MNPDDKLPQIEADIRALSLPGGRRVGQPGHEEAKQYLLGRMHDVGLEPFVGADLALPYTARHPETGKPHEFANLVGRFSGADPSARPILIGAHYDSVIDAPCSDDNAAAVAVALACAERIRKGGLRRSTVIALFDAEEPPFYQTAAMGSIRFYNDHCADTRFACVIVMDLVGHDVEARSRLAAGLIPRLDEWLFVLGCESHHALPGVLETAARGIDSLQVIPTLNAYVGDMSDHGAFRVGGEPFLFLTCGQGRYYHHPRDNMDWINLKKVHRVYDLVLNLARAADAKSLDGRPAGTDTVEFEIRMIESALGKQALEGLAALGLPPLHTRADLNLVLATLRGALQV